MDFPTDRPPSAPVAAAARRVVLGFGIREIGLGALGLAVLAATGVWLHRHFSHADDELAAIRVQLAARADAMDSYRQRFAALRWDAVQIRRWAEAQNAEPLRTWARERARRFDAMVAQVNHEWEANAFANGRAQIEELCAHGDVAAAKARLGELPVVVFPPAAELQALRQRMYEAPLAEFSRQNPDYYRAFRRLEPEASMQDEAALRAEITKAGDNVTPQLMLKVDLLAAVAAPDDPVVAEWSALASAMDYFENPDPATLAHWRKARHAIRANDWGTAANEMQSIVTAKVRTRQPFRASYGIVLLRSRPDQPAEAYPYLAEAAAAGDKSARSWVAQQDYAEKRYPQAKRWIEAAVADGDLATLPLLLELYDQHANEIPREPAREAAMLERVSDRPDAPPEAALLLGRMYERGDPPGSTAAKAFAAYDRAAAKGSAKGNAEVARCALRGIGTAENLELARDAACRAFAGGEREQSAALLIELMKRVPDRTAGAIERLFGTENVTTAAPYLVRTIVDGPGVAQLKAALAAYYDQIGQYGTAAKFYAGVKDAAAVQRHAELMAVHVCETCGGLGKIEASAPCPTCGGTGKQICSFCGGTGFIFAPGTPPCSTCGGSGTIVQDRKVVTCSTCGGTGKGKGSVIKQDCTHCEHGYIRCTECTNGTIKVTKECPDCHGRGSWSLAERGKE
jgi:TPR repeat protein